MRSRLIIEKRHHEIIKVIKTTDIWVNSDFKLQDTVSHQPVLI